MKLRTVAWTLMVSLGAGTGLAQDWPQWRGAQRDAKAVNFKAPKSWPRELTQKWKVTVGEGVASPALVGDKLYVFSRQEGNEVIRCLTVADGKEVWADRYESLGASGAAQSFSGPRSSPAVANGKVVTIGVRGTISGLEAATGQKLWRKDEFKAWPGFFPSSSPIIVDNLVIAQLGGRTNGAVIAYDLASGEPKWKWDGPSPAYASPTLLNVGGAKLIAAQTESKLVLLNVANGTLAWESAVAAGGQPGEGRPGGGGGGGGGRGGGGGGGRDYKAATPIADGQNIIIAGRGLKAIKLEKSGDKFVATDLWNNPEKSVLFNTPTLKDGMIYGLTPNNELFCLSAKDGSVVWSAPFPAPAPRAAAFRAVPAQTVFAQAPAAPATPADQGRPRGPGGPGGGRRGGGGGGGGFGSIVDAGSVLLALTPNAQLVIFEPNAKEFKEVASYKVSDSQTHAYPVVSGQRIFIKDKDSVALWTVE